MLTHGWITRKHNASDTPISGRDINTVGLNITKLDAWQCPAWWPPVGWVRTPVPFPRLWTKVHQIRFVRERVSTVCNAVFRLIMCYCVPEIFAIKSQSCVKLRRNFDVFGLPNFGGKGHPDFWQNFINLGHHRTRGSLEMIGQANSVTGRQKKI